MIKGAWTKHLKSEIVKNYQILMLKVWEQVGIIKAVWINEW